MITNVVIMVVIIFNQTGMIRDVDAVVVKQQVCKETADKYLDNRLIRIDCIQ
jgi:hypothetical protein